MTTAPSGSPTRAISPPWWRPLCTEAETVVLVVDSYSSSTLASTYVLNITEGDCSGPDAGDSSSDSSSDSASDSSGISCFYWTYGTGTDPGVVDCFGRCRAARFLGDGSHCNAHFDCEALDFDGGDCLDVLDPCTLDDGGTVGVYDCDLSCVADTIGDGTCDEAFDCLDTELDGGDCRAEGVVCDDAGGFYDCDLDCVESYVADWVGDGICDDGSSWPGNLFCEAFDVDGGDCDVSVDGDADAGTDADADADTATGADTGSDADTGGPAVDDDTDSAASVYSRMSDGGASETSGDRFVVISEVMMNPAHVDDDREGEQIELYNRSSDPLDLNGYRVENRFGFFTIDEPVMLAPWGRTTLGPNVDPSTNGGATVDVGYDPDLFLLDNEFDNIQLYTPDGSLVSEVRYTACMGLEPGTALQAHDPDEHALSVVPSYWYDNWIDPALEMRSWCNASATYGDGDVGTPHAPNAKCPVSGRSVLGAG